MKAKGSSGNRNLRSRGPVSGPILTFSLLGGAVAWLLHLLLAYLISEFGCLLGLGSVFFAGLSVVTWGLLVASATALGLALVATGISYRSLQHIRGFERRTSSDRTPEAFAARAGLMSNLFFVFVIVIQCVPIFHFLTDC